MLTPNIYYSCRDAYRNRAAGEPGGCANHFTTHASVVFQEGHDKKFLVERMQEALGNIDGGQTQTKTHGDFGYGDKGGVKVGLPPVS